MESIAATLIAGGFVWGALIAVVSPLRSPTRVLSLSGAMVGCVGALLLGTRVIVTGDVWQLSIAGIFPLLGGLVLTLDRLGAVFLAIIGFTGLASSLYAIGYLAETSRSIPAGPPASSRGRGTRDRGTLALYSLFLAGMCLVPAAGNVFTFLFGWELMALASYLLIVGNRSQEDAPAAGLWYAVMTHAGFVALLAAFLMLAGGGALDFASLRTGAARLSPTARLWVFWLGLFAFGSKAGLVPLHVWLPRAHPAAPSHVSALMSGAMVKLGAYGCIRLFLDLLAEGPAWWGGVLMMLGLVTALAGVLYSVADTHLKRVLAHSTIENMGIVFIGIGFALLMTGYGYDNLAAIGLVVALLHTVNHACYKALLFLSAGAVVHAVHEPSLESYGGLIKRMPQTAALCLIGALSLAAVPPFNGFASEWLTFQVLVAGARHTAPELAILLPLALGGLALTAGLAAVSAVRMFGITFLALPRSAAAAAASEAPAAMRVAMIVLAAACMALGLGPAIPVLALSDVVADLHLPIEALATAVSLTLPLVDSRFAPALLAAIMAGAAVAVIGSSRLAGRRVRRDTAWNCGRIAYSPRSEYTAASFAEPLKRVFTGFYRPTEEVTVDTHPQSRYFVRAMAYRGALTPWLEQMLYAPLVNIVMWLSARARRVQTGSIHAYLAYLVVALVAMLMLTQWVS